VCDDEHLWRLAGGSVVPTPKLSVGDSISVAKPIVTAAAELPIDPYVFGLWLADGKHTSGEITKPDEFIWQEISRRGYTVGDDSSGGRCPTRTVYGIRKHLASLGVLRNKHIPTVYLRASIAQRLDLLRGLMDGDGSANPQRKQAIYTACNKRLSDGVMELAISLGQRVLQSKTTQHGFGLTVRAWPLSWRPQNGLVPFLLPRKANKILPTWGSGSSNARRIVSIRKVDRVPTQCITVDSPTSTYLCTNKFIPTHNTGKRKPDLTQLKLFAGLAFASFPNLEVINTGFVWLKHGTIDKKEYTRKEVPMIWQEFIPRVQRMQRAYDEDKFPPKPSGLCRNYCAVPKHKCEFSGRER
jgi:hypothetical protein